MWTIKQIIANVSRFASPLEGILCASRLNEPLIQQSISLLVHQGEICPIQASISLTKLSHAPNSIFQSCLCVIVCGYYVCDRWRELSCVGRHEQCVYTLFRVIQIITSCWETRDWNSCLPPPLCTTGLAYRSDCRSILLYSTLSSSFYAAALVKALWKGVRGKKKKQGFQSSHVETAEEAKDEAEEKQNVCAAICVFVIEQRGIIVWPLTFHFPLICPWLFLH